MSGTAGGLTTKAPEQAADSSRFSDSETEVRSPSRSPSDILSGVYRGIKKFAPARDDTKHTRQQSQSSFLGQKNLSPLSAVSTSSAPLPSLLRPANHKHARSLSLQNSLEKPLPEPPPPQLSPTSPLTPLASVANGSFSTIADSEPEREMDSRTSTMDSSTSGPGQLYTGGGGQAAGYTSNMMPSHLTSSQTSLGGTKTENDTMTPRSNGPLSAGQSPPSQQGQTSRTSSLPSAHTPSSATAPSSSSHLSGLMCNVHRTTGKEPPPLVGATTTVLGDKLYVFGGRVLSRSRPAPLTSDLYELDLIRRHWTKIETTGDIPPPRYFHSMCALGDTKMVCYGGMSPSTSTANANGQEQAQPEVVVLSDIYIFDVTSRKWTFIPTNDPPQGRYAHCACILPSSAVFASHRAPLSALQHNPSSGNPNEGRIGVNIDGTGGAEMVIVGGQDALNHYIEEISVFNLRSLKWTSTQPLGKSCGAYRSVVAPLPPSVAAKIGRTNPDGTVQQGGISQEAREPGSSMLIYSNYNFLDVKLELQIRSSDGTMSEKPIGGALSPPGLRFPNGGVIDTSFVVSGTYLTSSKQEYALWALNLRTLTWTRVDAGGSVFSQGSWNRGVLWNRRNTFVILGNRKRSLVDDYNHRRINFTNVCMVELEAFGFYDNPRRTAPTSGFVSASSPYYYSGQMLSLARRAGSTGGGRYHGRAAEELGERALGMRELADMDILCLTGERIPVNSRIMARRWGPYFVQLLREATASQEGGDAVAAHNAAIAAQMGMGVAGQGMGNSRISIATITPQSSRNTLDSNLSTSTMMTASSGSSIKPPSTATSTTSLGSPAGPALGVPGTAGVAPNAAGPAVADPSALNTAPTPRSLPPSSRPRCLYLPHMYLTVQALLHFIYTSSLPSPTSPLCTPQILCSLLQIARPYRVDGLLEAVVERLHGLLDSRNAAAVFNATAMAAGGGRGIDPHLVGGLGMVQTPLGAFEAAAATVMNPGTGADGAAAAGAAPGAAAVPVNGSTSTPTATGAPERDTAMQGVVSRAAALRINTELGANGIQATGTAASARPGSEEMSATTSVSGSEWGSEMGDNDRDSTLGSSRANGGSGAQREPWSGELSSVIGLQKRGLKGLMEGRRMRERTGTNASVQSSGGPPGSAGGLPPGSATSSMSAYSRSQQVGLGIAGS